MCPNCLCPVPSPSQLGTDVDNVKFAKLYIWHASILLSSLHSFLLNNNQIITTVSKWATWCAALTSRGLVALLPSQLVSQSFPGKLVHTHHMAAMNFLLKFMMIKILKASESSTYKENTKSQRPGLDHSDANIC